MNRNSLKTPTGRTSWLFTKRAGVEFGATEDKSIQWQGGGLEPGTSGLQVQRPNHYATLASSIRKNNVELTLQTSALQTLCGGQFYVINLVDGTKLSSNTTNDAAPKVFLILSIDF